MELHHIFPDFLSGAPATSCLGSGFPNVIWKSSYSERGSGRSGLPCDPKRILLQPLGCQLDLKYLHLLWKLGLGVFCTAALTFHAKRWTYHADIEMSARRFWNVCHRLITHEATHPSLKSSNSTLPDVLLCADGPQLPIPGACLPPPDRITHSG